MTQRGTQAAGLGVIIGRCSDSQHGRAGRHPVNVGCFFQVQEWRFKEPPQPETQTQNMD